MNSQQASFKAVITNPQFVTVIILLAVISLVIAFFSFEIIPFVIAMGLAYFLDRGIRRLEHSGMRRGRALALVYAVYLIGYFGLLVGPLPVILRRGLDMLRKLPASGQELLHQIEAMRTVTLGLLDEEQTEALLSFLLKNMREGIQTLLEGSLGYLPQVTGWVIYLLLVPLLVFFFLKDKRKFLVGIARCLPRDRRLATEIWLEMETRMGSYIQSKIWEILGMGVVTWAVFWLLGFDYPAVLGLISGISVVIPYVGAFAVAVPVLLLGFMQWGATSQLWWLIGAYVLIQVVDGNLVNPLLFSEAVKLHPVIILLAVFLFGSIWGVWGVFFAIPLATLCKTLLNTVLEFREQRTF